MPHHHQTNSQTNLTFLKSNYKFKRREMGIRGLPATSAEARTVANQLTPAMSQTSASATSTKVATSEGTAAEQLATAATSRECRTILSLFIVNAWSFLQELANCWCTLDDDHWASAAVPRRDVNRRRRRTTNTADEEVSMAREHQHKRQQQQQHHQQQQQQQQQHEHLPGSSPVKSMRCTEAGATSLAGQPLMALLIGLLLLDLRLAAAGTCWQNHLGSGKCGQVFSTNITRSECCGSSQSFSFTDRELSSVEYFFATAIGGGVECSPCMESCKGFKCGPNKKCVKRKGRPKCVCAPECGAALRRKQQPGMPPRDSRSLSSENSNTNLGLDGSQRQHIADNQRKLQQQHQNQVASPSPTPSPRHRRLLIIDSSNLPDRSRSRGGVVTAGRVEMTGYERRRQRNSHGNGKHLTRSMTTGANDSSKPADKTPAQSVAVAVPMAPVEALTQPPSRRNLANANEPANDINRQSDNARLRHQHNGRRMELHAPHPDNGHRDRDRDRDKDRGQRHRLRLRHKDAYPEVEANSTTGGATSTVVSGSRFRLQHGSETAASSDFANAHDLAFLGGIYEHSSSLSLSPNSNSNPVCGSDGRTYNTECQLRKRACRTNNAQLEVAYRGHCKTSCHGVQCLDGLSCVEDQYMMPHCIACQIDCPWDGLDLDLDANSSGYDERQAVCGVDGKTYRSACDINRMICQIGRSIAVAYPGPCRAGRVSCADIKCGPKDNCLVDLQTGLPRCVSCRHKCSRKQQRPVHKICGFNNRTYNSWCEMQRHSCDSRYFIGVKSAGSC
ncbi:hypothetical protein KR200_008947 [Drosophila serrata]|nr:hypothetical protein KR200_008947 [Drosophila serrata]